MSSYSYNKSHKPLVERRRRERINRSLEELKLLVLSNHPRDESEYSRMEKADILDMTASFLRSCQSSVPSPVGVSKYRSGFQECAGLVLSHLSRSADIPLAVRLHLFERLTARLQRLPYSTNQPTGSTPPDANSFQPLRISIPEVPSPHSPVTSETPASLSIPSQPDSEESKGGKKKCEATKVQIYHLNTSAKSQLKKICEQPLNKKRSQSEKVGIDLKQKPPGSVKQCNSKSMQIGNSHIADKEASAVFGESSYVWRPF